MNSKSFTESEYNKLAKQIIGVNDFKYVKQSDTSYSYLYSPSTNIMIANEPFTEEAYTDSRKKFISDEFTKLKKFLKSSNYIKHLEYLGNYKNSSIQNVAIKTGKPVIKSADLMKLLIVDPVNICGLDIDTFVRGQQTLQTFSYFNKYKVAKLDNINYIVADKSNKVYYYDTWKVVTDKDLAKKVRIKAGLFK